MKLPVILGLTLWVNIGLAEGIFQTHIVENGNYAEIQEYILEGITSQGLLVAHKSNVAGMLNRTGTDLGDSTKVYQHGEIIEFCSASLSRAITNANPHNIMFCPFSLGIYQLSGDNKVYISYMRLSKLTAKYDAASREAFKKVEDVLVEIVAEAIE